MKYIYVLGDCFDESDWENVVLDSSFHCDIVEEFGYSLDSNPGTLELTTYELRNGNNVLYVRVDEMKKQLILAKTSIQIQRLDDEEIQRQQDEDQSHNWSSLLTHLQMVMTREGVTEQELDNIQDVMNWMNA
mgnify:CR=1 FL=1